MMKNKIYYLGEKPEKIFEGSTHDPNLYTILQASQRHINFES